MRRTFVIAAFGLALLAVLAVPAMGLASDASVQAEDDEHNETAPGEQLAGVVGVQGAELDGDLDQRAFGLQFGQAADNETRADVIAQRVGDVDERLADLRERKATLEERREAGEIRQGTYRAEMAKVEAEIRMLERAVNQTERAAGAVPPGLLAERGVDGERIQQLRQNASDLAGPEVAEIARGIAGPPAGEPPGHGNATGPPVNATGPPAGDDHPASDRAGGNQSAGPGSGAADDAGNASQSPGGPDDAGNASQSPGGPDDAGNDRAGDDDDDAAADDEDDE